MALNRFLEDMNILGKLSDEPNDWEGLTADEVKVLFDRAGQRIQAFLNQTHLPEVEAALDELLTAARLYADQKVVEIGSGDMAMAEYDPDRKRVNLFAYAETAAMQQADAVRGEVEAVYRRAKWYGRGFVGVSQTNAASGTTGPSVIVPVQLAGLHDPDGMLGADTETLTMPDGAARVLLTLDMLWGQMPFAGAHMDVLVNDLVVVSVQPPNVEASGTLARENTVFALDAAGGDRLRVLLYAMYGGSGRASALHARNVRLEVLE